MPKPSRLSRMEEILPSLRAHAKSLEIGEQMPTEHQIVEQYGVSRQTAREAFATLRAEGFIEVKHGRGAFRTDKAESDRVHFEEWFKSNEFEISELLEMRAAVEPYIAELAAQHITEDELEQLRKSVEGFNAILLDDKVDAKVAADEEFHGIILTASRNSALRMFYETFIPSLRTYRAHVFSPPADPLLALPHHQRIYSALAAHDGKAAAQLMRNHIDHSRLDARRLADVD